MGTSYDLFKFFHQEHNLILTQSEMADIIYEVLRSENLNNKLIEAAPDLLDALKSLHEENMKNKLYIGSNFHSTAITAIKKATT